jgi:hypothetical protein
MTIHKSKETIWGKGGCFTKKMSNSKWNEYVNSKNILIARI